MKQPTNHQAKKPHVVVFFTWDVSLRIWKDKGLLARELRLYEQLHKRGIDFTFITWGNQSDLEIAKSCGQFNFIPLYTLIPCPACKTLRALCSLLAPFKLSHRVKNVDIIKTNQMWGSWVAVLFKWIVRKPLILRSGYELYDFTVKSNASKLRQRFIKLISKIGYKNADQVFLATDHDRRVVISNFQVNDSLITLRPNWIDTNIFRPLALTTTKNRLLFVGRLSSQKNLKMLIDACTAENVGLDIYGDGDMRNELENYVGSKNADVLFKGAVANNELPQIYNEYLAYVLCSHYEGNPKTLLEAMSCGALCIGTKVDGIKNILEHEKTGLLCDKTLDALRGVVSRVMTSEESFSDMRHAAAQVIAKFYSLNCAVEHELTSYKEIIND